MKPYRCVFITALKQKFLLSNGSIRIITSNIFLEAPSIINETVKKHAVPLADTIEKVYRAQPQFFK